MPQYNLAAPEEKVVVTWLFEPNGYLENWSIRVSDGKTAKEALAEDSALDVTQWIRDNEMVQFPRWPTVVDQVAMCWWIWKNDNVNIPPPQRPPETPIWIAILEHWTTTSQAGFDRASQADRNINTVPIADETGEYVETMPAGAQLAHQQSIFRKVLEVLQ